MKCKECTSCRLGFCKSQPNSYVCIGVKEPFVDDNGIYGVSSSNPPCNYLIMSRELFVEAYNKWIRDPNTDDWK